MLHLDGTIEVRVSASGYLQGGFWESTQGGYGTKIRDTTSQYLSNPCQRMISDANLQWEVFTTMLLISR